MKNLPSTNLHKLSAERVAKVAKKLIKRLVQKGVLQSPAPATTTPPENPKPEGQQRATQFSGILDCQPQSVYRAFRVIEGDKSQTNPPTALGRKSDHEDDR